MNTINAETLLYGTALEWATKAEETILFAKPGVPVCQQRLDMAAAQNRVADFLYDCHLHAYATRHYMDERREDLAAAAEQCKIHGHWYEWIDPEDNTKGEICISCGSVRAFAW